MRKRCLFIALFVFLNPFFSYAEDSVEILVTPKITTHDSEAIVVEALSASDQSYTINREVAPDIYIATVKPEDISELQSNSAVVVQKNQRRSLAISNLDLLEHIGANTLHEAPYSAGGQNYAIAVIDTGVRSTHRYFTESGEVFDQDTNPSRVVIEHCQSGGFPITDSDGEYILDGDGDKLYEGISTCNGNRAEPTDIAGFTYYSNTIPGTLTSVAGAALPCGGEYPGFTFGCKHGSHVAGIAAGTNASYNDVSHSGVAPSAPIIAFNVFTKYTDPSICGSGPCLLANDADILSALAQIEELALTGVKIGAVNMSLGGGSYSDEELCKQDHLVYFNAFERLWALGIPVVIASGNGGYRDKVSAPACVPNAISVGATTVSVPDIDSIATYSNVASFLDFVAPGSALVSADSDTETDFFVASGTSMSTPVVAGAYSLLLSLFDGTQPLFPYRNLDTITSALKNSAVLMNDMRSGGSVVELPRINVASAVAGLLSTPTITTPAVNTTTISYPMEYTFTISGSVNIDDNTVETTELTTVTHEEIECTPDVVTTYDCNMVVTSPGVLQLKVTDVIGNVYITSLIDFPEPPIVPASVPSAPVVVSSSSGGGGGGSSGVSGPIEMSPEEQTNFCSAQMIYQLSEGSSEKNVLYAERALQKLGYFTSLPNTDYNSATTIAVRGFQQKYSPSKVTGSVDGETWSLLQFYGGCGAGNQKREIFDSILKDSIPPKGFTKTIRQGSKSPLLEYIQSRLIRLGYIKSTSVIAKRYTKTMKNAVKKFQQSKGIASTGNIDTKTFTLLSVE